MACIDFGITSFCSQVSNIAVAHGNSQAFLTWQIAGYNHPAFGGCSSANWPNGGWFESRVSVWTNMLANTTGTMARAKLIAQIDWANCMMNECCGQGGLAIYGCMDDGTRGNDYINNQGTYANPQYGSVNSGTPALNYYAGATQDNGSCIYTQPVHGCKDPAATNYDPNADTDCGNSYVSDFNINYTNWQGIQPPGNWTPYGDTGCCTYKPTVVPDYNWRDGGALSKGGFYNSSTDGGGTYWNVAGTYGPDGQSIANLYDPNTYGYDGFIGKDWLMMAICRDDADGNYYTNAEFSNMSGGNYIITLYDRNHQYLGKWEYSLVHVYSQLSYCTPPCNVFTTDDSCYVQIFMKLEAHLDGSWPIVDFGSKHQITPIPVLISNNNPNNLPAGPPHNNADYTSPYFGSPNSLSHAYMVLDWPGRKGNLVNASQAINLQTSQPYPGYSSAYPVMLPTQAVGNLERTKYTCSCNIPGPDSVCSWTYQSISHPHFVWSGTQCNYTSPTSCWSLAGSSLKLANPEGEDINVKGLNTIPYSVELSCTKDTNQEMVVNTSDNTLFFSENHSPSLVSLSALIPKDVNAEVFTVKFRAKKGYYYSKPPSLNMNFPGVENYKIKVESESKNARGYVTEKTFNVNYKNTGFDIYEEDGHNIIFTTKIAKEVDTSTETQVKEITALRIDTSSVDSSGDSRNISVVGTPGSTFSLTIKDKNGRNVLPYSGKITKTIKTAISASNTLELNNATGLEVGMIVLNGQRRNVKITGISDSVKTNVDAINETSTTYISISSHLTFAADASIIFAKETDITEVAIPDSGAYYFTQEFPPLEKFKRTLKTAASATTSLTLDYTSDLENDMRITGTGVDGNNPTIGLIKLSTTQGVDPDGVTINVSDAQTIADETELTFEMPDNRYDITLYPLMAILGDDVPRYSSTDCDTLPTYSIYQYIDPIVEIAPSSALSNVTVDGTVTFTGKANRAAGTNGDITISMTATKSDGNLATSRAPRFSSIDSESSDFSNTLNTVAKKVREGDCNDRDIVHLNNVAGIRVGMIVTGGGINTNKTITVKSITGTAVKLSEKQTIQKDDTLTFSSMFNMHISSLTATLSPNGGQATGICTIAGTGKITTFGIDSFTSTFAFDNFLSIPG